MPIKLLLACATWVTLHPCAMATVVGEAGEVGETVAPAGAALRDVTEALVVPSIDAVGKDTLLVGFELRGVPITLEVRSHSVRSARYRVLVEDERGRRIADASLVRTWRGSVRLSPGTAVAASIVDRRVLARVILDDGSTLWLEPLAPADGVEPMHHRLYRTSGVGWARCGVDVARASAPSTAMRHVTRRRGPSAVVCAELACDTDHEFVRQWGSRSAVEDRINAIVNMVNLQYERDVGVRHEIGTIIVRTRADDPYRASSAVALTGELRAHWIGELGDVPRDLVHLFTGRDLDGGAIGYAWQIGSICTDGAFCVARSGTRGDFARITDLTAHELGHLWGGVHCSCLVPPYTMNAGITGANVFHPVHTIPAITAVRDRVACLSRCGRSTCAPDCGYVDGLVGVRDLLALLAEWGSTGECDLTGNGVIDEDDVAIMLAHWGACSGE